ncbi:MAG: hypothetical protein IJG68_07475 [Bacilli bacterium]|nr:hypothetical protein [Bacilli bacterium]
MRRMDRYGDENTKVSRSLKNQELYQDVANNPKYTNITDVRNVNAYEINSANDATTREKYQQVKKYQELPKVKRELDDFNHLYPKTEKKIYDINTVLEDARKNRKDDVELEEKRKLKYTSYNILAGINLEELMKYREEKKKRQATPEEEEIHDLMDTIASKTLAGELDKETTVDLLSDLMATNMLDKVSPSEEISESKVEVPEDLQKELTKEKPLLSEMVQELEAKKGQEIENSSSVDKDFYTKSMDLSEEDFEMSDDFAEKKLPVGVKILLVIIVLVVLAVAGYFIYQKLI